MHLCLRCSGLGGSVREHDHPRHGERGQQPTTFICVRIPDKMNAKIGLSERPGLVLATRQGYLPCRSWPEPDGWEDVQGRLSDERSELALDILPAIWHARRRPAMTRSSSPI